MVSFHSKIEFVNKDDIDANEVWKKHLHALGIEESDIKELEEFNRKIIENMPKENN